MNEKHILVVEDEALIAHELCEAIAEMGHVPIGPAVNHSGAVALAEQHVVDLALVDIQLTGFKDGIEFAERVRESGLFPVLFLTANSDAATVERATRTDPAGFLVKPIQRAQLGAAVTVALSNWQRRYRSLPDPASNKGTFILEHDAVFISDGWQHHKILLDSVLFLRSDHVYVEIHTRLDRYVVRMALSKLEDVLDPAVFVRIHRSHIVNVRHITRFDKRQVWVGATQLGIGSHYREGLMARLPIL
jgi:DNA-binding LytR/AlgR family response regulator